MKRLIAGFTAALFFLLTVTNPVLAQNTYVCLDNDTLQNSYNYSITMDDDNMNISVVKNENCQFGCDSVTNSCSPDPLTKNMYFGGGLIVLMFVVWIVRKVVLPK